MEDFGAEGEGGLSVKRGVSVLVRVISQSLIVRSKEPDAIHFCSRL